MSYVVNYYCQNCGSWSPKWLGRCPDCGQYNSFVEEKVKKGSGFQGKPDPNSYNWAFSSKPVPITEAAAAKIQRLSTLSSELDRVLGGGLLPGAVVLVGGEPGIGKSTLWLQTAGRLAKNAPVLVVSGEESLVQIKLRAERVKINSPNLYLLNEINVFNIEKAVQEIKPALLIIDSIQTVFHPELAAAPGGVGQIRESAGYLIRLAKASSLPLVLIGHITKEGAIAGPRVLEHMVDTVLYFEGEHTSSSYRLIRSVKNRFGPSFEIGLFEMHDDGLKEVTDTTKVFLTQERSRGAGSVVAVIMEGTRPLLLEIQALVSPTYLTNPRRLFSGIDAGRALITLAVLEKKLKLNLGQADVYLNVVGGVKVLEPAVDLPVALAVLSAYYDKPIAADWCFFGELGLSGEIRPINHAYVRLKEAAKIGFSRCLMPKQAVKEKISSLKVLQANSLQEAVNQVF